MSEANSNEKIHDPNAADKVDDSLLIDRIWSALDEFRASSFLRLDGYAKPVLDLLFLAEVNRRPIALPATFPNIC